MRPDLRRLAAAAAGFSTAILLAAAPARAGADVPFAGIEPLSAAELTVLRGGFVSSGVLLRFGVDVTAYLNGQQVSHTVLTSGELGPGGLSVRPGSSTSMPLPEGINISTTLTAGGAVLNVIQNTLDHQTIQTIANVHLDILNLPDLTRRPAWESINDAVRALGVQ